MFELYYLADQGGDIHGDKCPQAYFETIQECHDRAEQESVAHYSIEFETPSEATILYVC